MLGRKRSTSVLRLASTNLMVLLTVSTQHISVFTVMINLSSIRLKSIASTHPTGDEAANLPNRILTFIWLQKNP
jgi:hypothetical protein